MKTGEDGRRTDGEPLTYSRYLNVAAIREIAHPPVEVPRGVRAADWPEFPAGWKPGHRLPRDGNWAHDEALFISTHQAFEVWFRQLLHELDDLLITAGEVAAANGRSIPRVSLASRHGEAVPRLADRRSRYPRLAKLAEESENGDQILETAAPAHLGVEAPKARLAWFEDRWPTWCDRVERAAHILNVCVPFYAVLQHMTPVAFLEFRERLIPASGFGSGQFREIEIGLGMRELHLGKIDWETEAAKPIHDALPPAEKELARAFRAPETAFSRHSPDDADRIVARMAEPSLRDLVYWLLNAEELAGADDALRYDVADRIAERNYRHLEHWQTPDPKRVGIVASNDVWREMGLYLAETETVAGCRLHREPGGHGAFRRFLESCLTLDEALHHWRTAHIRFVERMIGARPGTGGGGVRYLRATVDARQAPYKRRVFPCLWNERTVLL